MSAAAQHHDAPHGDERVYPERIAIRLTSLAKPIYAELEDAQMQDGVSIASRILALVDLYWIEASPEQRNEVIQRAQKIQWETHQRARKQRNRSWEYKRQKKKAALTVDN